MATPSLAERDRFNVVFAPGGFGARRAVGDVALLGWLTRAGATADYALSVCTGSAPPARAGLLDEQRATTNKAAFGWVASQGPNVDGAARARWVEDGRFFTASGVSASGVSAGMDMALAPIAAMQGRARQIASWAAYRWPEYRWEEDAGRRNPTPTRLRPSMVWGDATGRIKPL